MAEESQLPLQSEKVLSYAIRPHLLAYCSRTDLFAVVTQEEVIEVYRLGGQRAFSVKRKSPQITIVGLQWIRNGKCLAVALSNGYLDIISGETGKIIRHGGDDPFSTDTSDSNEERGSITCLGWGTVLTREAISSDAAKGANQDDLTTDDWYQRLQEKRGDALLAEDDLELKSQKASLNDLPRQLAFIDVESVLPRLSPIPTRHTASGRYDMFATQAALDDYFSSMQRKDRLAADIMFVGYPGKNRVIIDDILEIGFTPEPSLSQKKRSAQMPILYASHPRSKFHALLRGTPETPINDSSTDRQNGYKDLNLSLFDIPLLASGGSHLHLIVSRTAQLRDLCGYISYSIICAKSDWTTHTNLPSRFMENVNETLEEKGEGVLEQNLYHLAMTGNYTPTILEWLRDELAERGHKRWDHAMTTLYTELSKIFLTNLLPVLERCSVVATNLRGLARYYADSNKFSVSPRTFADILDVLNCLQLLVHEAVQVLGQEQRQFRAFSKWLRHQIDLAAADPESLSAKDMAEREAANLDYPSVLAYLEGALTKSRLKAMVHNLPSLLECPSTKSEDLIRAIHAGRKPDAECSPMLSLHVWSTNLANVCKAAHQHISEWQHAAQPRSHITKCTVDGVKGFSDVLDMKMVEMTPGSFKAFVIGVPTDTPNAEWYSEIALWHSWMGPQGPDGEIGNGWRQIQLPPNGIIHSLKFLDDETYLAIFEHENTYHLLCLPYFNPSNPDEDCPNTFGDMEGLRPYIAHTFDGKDGFVPREMQVNGRVGKKNVTVVAKDLRRWRILDLEGFRSRPVEAGKGEGEENMYIDE